MSLMFIFAISVAVATFIENDFGTETAQYEIFKSSWFELLLIFITFSLIATFIKYRMFLFKRWFVSLTHLSFIIVALGALTTRYVGFEGVLHFREGEEKNFIVSTDNFIDVSINNKEYSKIKLFSNLSKNNFEFENENIQISLINFVPYASNKYIETNSSNSHSKIDFIISLGSGLQPQNLSLWNGETINLGFFALNFSDFNLLEQNISNSDIYVYKLDSKLYLRSELNISRMSMATQVNEEFEKNVEILSRYLYTIGDTSIVFKDIKIGIEESEVSMLSAPKKEREQFPHKLYFSVKDTKNNLEKNISVIGRAGEIGKNSTAQLGENKISVSYGARILPLPFAIHLNDFVLERYAGSMSPSSYSSFVTLKDSEANVSMKYHIYMNHILDYKGYRFFQSSYDMDEGGSILSVNFDPGTPITYLAYILMFIGLTGSIFAKGSRFQKLKEKLKENSSIANIFIAVLLFSFFSSTNLKAEKIEIENPDFIFKFEKNHADKFGSLIVQDSGGRFKPLDSLNLDILNKIGRTHELAGLNHNQIILGMILKPNLWKQIKLIYINDEVVNKLLGIDLNEKRASFDDFFEDPQILEGYKIASQVEEAMRTPEKNRDRFQKTILKIDERVNIALMIYSGALLKIFPNPDQAKINSGWVSTIEALQKFDANNSEMVRNIIIGYFSAVNQALISGNWNESDLNLNNIFAFQMKFGNNVIDFDRLNGEKIYNNLNIFERLIAPTLLIGFLVGILALIELLKDKKFIKLSLIFRSSLFLIFIFMTFGLALRWYISGHAPWSDAYESLLYIGWASLLAGILLGKNSLFSLSATTILAGVIFFVANLSWLDPQITNLVPVLKSYWLTIHVSLITASYGFLGLGAFLGIFTLMIFALKNINNGERFNKKILELNILNEMNLTIGLILLTVGNFLGGVWANESWGRYWGWDPKESWALVTILVYVMILHTRFIPKLWSNYIFPLLSIIGFSSVIMTYFGVNFYLSGMHSYAQGDPVPVPMFVYYLLTGLSILMLLAWRKRAI